MIDNDWSHTDPEANYRGWVSVQHICCLFAFTTRLRPFFFQTDICLSYQRSTQRRSDMRCKHTWEALLHPVRQDVSQWFPRGWAHKVASCNPLKTAAVADTRTNKPDSSDVWQYNAEHKRVMFSSVKAAICVWDLGFNNAFFRQPLAWVDSHPFSKFSPF